MGEPIYVNLAFEDDLSEAVLRKLLLSSGQNYHICTCYTRGGKGYLEKCIRAWNSAASAMPFVVLTDLDEVECAPALVRDWLGQDPHPNLVFRVAIREVEAWLLAHRSGISKFLGVQVDLIPQDFDNTPDPKQVLIDIAAKSPSGELRHDIVPRAGSTSRQGPSYNFRMTHFVEKYWDPHVAAQYSPSLCRTIKAFGNFVSVRL